MSDEKVTAAEGQAVVAPSQDVAPPYESPHCLRCGLDWKARNPQARPSSCPRCGSALWDKPPQRKNARRPDDPPNPNWSYRLKPIKKKCPTCGKPMRRLTVAERQELEEKRQRELRERMTIEGERAAMEQPARPGAVPARFGLTGPGPRAMTPPPSLRGPTPPPMQSRGPETPEVQASRRTTTTTATLSEQLKEETT